MASPAPRSVFIRLDARAGDPLQTRIYESIRLAILEGVLAPGSRLTSSRALAVELGVSRTTALLALEQLTAEGYLTARRGSGTYVSEDLPDDLPRRRVPPAGGEPRHPPISRRAAAQAIIPRLARRCPGPPRVFRLGVPALDLFPMRQWSQMVSRRLRSLTLSQIDYGHPAGVPALREAIAAHVQSARGTRCTPDQIVIVAGSQRGVELTCDIALDHGDEAWMEEPGYAGMRSALIRSGARILTAPVDGEGLVVDTVTRHGGNARLVCVTPSHQFPTGVPLSLPRRLALLRWASAARAWILEDDYDSEYRYGARPVPCLHGLDVDGRVIYVGSFSKTLFPAIRLGFLIVPADLQETILGIRHTSDQHPPVLEQAVLADFMAGGHYERHLRRMRSASRERLEAMADAARRFCGGVLRVRPVHSGLHAVADLDESAPADIVSREAWNRGVEVMPLSGYFQSSPCTVNGLVLGFAPIRPEAMAPGMERLAAAIEAGRAAGRRETRRRA